MTLRLLINASNLRVGGVVQVGISAIDEISRLGPEGMEISVLACEGVDRNLSQIGCDTGAFARYRVRSVPGLSPFDPVLDEEIARADAVFTIFGPLYARRRPKVSVMGFAQPWIIYPKNDIYRGLSPIAKAKSRLKYGVQAAILRRNADHAIVEAGHVKEGLVARGLFRTGQVSVVSNCVSDIFRQPELWRPVALPVALRERKGWRIGFLGRDYPHKNLSILPDVARVLRERHGIVVDFLVTLTEAEWQARSPEFRSAVTNVGPLDLAQCPSFYAGLDAAIFPSLLECFSVMPLEAMAMGLRVFASDRPFVRDICGPFARYFDPHAPEEAAACIAEGLATPPSEEEREMIRAQGFAGMSPRERAESYLEIIRRVVVEKNGPVRPGARIPLRG
ncbi:group 1 glycosyl transferase [Haematobacter missouriensis]|uniref:Group 1 glycosyl transferase n=1 Tax=Haematobacter missouriensis TaxID=366616 RepID=A0ABX3ZX81_9RHOB|nr:glycosyltransferase [Haematobacter missouriensis]KFI27070.1 group 1 glycosyl transferase [Haematobacter missouriensis]OWJ78710.1 group 1 glycosyl transferase [Haematobacter missouriensis]